MPRLFLALEIPPELKQTVAHSLEWAACFSGQIKRVAPGNYHLTIQFLGSVAPERVPEIRAALEGPVRSLPPVDVQLADWGAFPSDKKPSVFWIGLEPSAQLQRIAGTCRKILEPLGFKPDQAVFVPHVTVARAGKKPVPRDFVAQWQQMPRPAGGNPFRCDRIALMESVTDPAGARYSVINHFAFLAP